MKDSERKEIAEIVVVAMKNFMENLRPMPVPVSAETMSNMQYLYASCCCCPPPCHCSYPPRYLGPKAKEGAQAISDKIGMSEEGVIGLAEQRIRKKQLEPGITLLVSDLNLTVDKSDLSLIIEKSIQAICGKTGLNEEEVLNLVEQRVRKQNIETEIDTLVQELGILISQG